MIKYNRRISGFAPYGDKYEYRRNGSRRQHPPRDGRSGCHKNFGGRDARRARSGLHPRRRRIAFRPSRESCDLRGTEGRGRSGRRPRGRHVFQRAALVYGRGRRRNIVSRRRRSDGVRPVGGPCRGRVPGGAGRVHPPRFHQRENDADRGGSDRPSDLGGHARAAETRGSRRERDTQRKDRLGYG